MEKITKKKKKSKRLRRRIGLIAVGGLSLVLTVCLSVGATLAWFAGSTWASNDMYMGGPVYVEMMGRGHAGSTNGTGENEGKWVGGDGKLDIVASARTTGTAKGTGTSGNTMNNYYTGEAVTSNKYDTSNVLLPGQKLLIYSQARVFSTAYSDNLSAGNYPNQSSGANTQNASNGTTSYTSSTGVKKTTTTSVLRAKFSINVELDPTVGFNNFTHPSFADGYPVQSVDYDGDGGSGNYTAYSTTSGFTKTAQDWEKALEGQAGAAKLATVKHTSGDESGYTKTYTLNSGSTNSATPEMVLNEYTGRRDYVENPIVKSGYTSTITGASAWDATEWVAPEQRSGDALNSVTPQMCAIKDGVSKSIYKWKYVDKTEYDSSSYKMGAPFDGKFNTLGTASKAGGGQGNGYYGIWVTDGSGNRLESDAFYKARCNYYIQSYQEHYENEYGNQLILQIGEQLYELENALNNSFKGLVNESSDNIMAGLVKGFTANDNGEIRHVSGSSQSASWLYVDPKIGNDTNASDSATSVGGWWYLVETANTESVVTGQNEVKAIRDKVVGSDGSTETCSSYAESSGTMTYTWSQNVNGVKNVPTELNNIVRKDLATGTSGYTAGALQLNSDDTRILNAKLFEVTPSADNGVIEEIGYGNGTYKVVSVAFPFVNGNFELPGKALTNIFANARISFHISFQALQAFFPFTPSIDGCDAGSALAGTGKALNIGNSIPIFNEAFDYLAFLSK